MMHLQILLITALAVLKVKCIHFFHSASLIHQSVCLLVPPNPAMAGASEELNGVVIVMNCEERLEDVMFLIVVAFLVDSNVLTPVDG